MPTNARESFIKSIWDPYPPMPGECMRISDLEKAREKNLSSFDLAAKILNLNVAEGWMTLGAQDQIWELELAGPWPLVGRDANLVEAREVIEAGDCLMIRMRDCQWRTRSIRAQVDSMLLLSPCLEELPSKVGYWGTATKWSQFVTAVREFFIHSGCLEVWTPSLVVCPGLEPTLDPLAVEVSLGAKEKKTLYLPTSPELHLKKLLATGGGDVFEIKECFRDGEYSDHHQPEFWMIEWYRAFAGLEIIARDIEGLLQYLVSKGVFTQPVGKIQRLTMAEIFRRFLNFELTPETTRKELLDQCSKWHLPVQGTEPWDDLFHLLFLAKVEPLLPELGPLLVTHFPPSQAALARLTDEGWADRFEFYWQGFEIANAFGELTDPAEQGARCDRDNRERAERGKKILPIDHQFLGALKTGMPPSGGIALGLERLFMAGMGIRDIRKVRAFVAEENL
ncbi:MAG: EF-P lysine aminoacylase GenX [Bdellovibrionales bacterium]|nr:EF-P lysine aminoacylase GenX [Bdellovibrionales bacterium]